MNAENKRKRVKGEAEVNNDALCVTDVLCLFRLLVWKPG